MDGTAFALVAGVASGFLTLTGAMGVVWRIILPWLRREILEPVHTTNEQVTNSHQSNLRDDLTEIKEKVCEQREEMIDMRELLVGHLAEARERDRRISRLEASQKRRLFPFAF